MPPAFLYRAATGEAEEILISGMPLGALAETEYTLRVAEFHRGDTLVLISDGLPELRNERGDLLGYPAVQEAVARHGGGTATELLAHLVDLGETWNQEGNGEARDDDITILVIRRV
jgi:sigma-B regulation protein RsbU (phosphoserine phosphatase)